MNLYEMRIDRFNFDTSENYDKYNSFSIGHESCIIKFFKIIQNTKFISFLQDQKDKGKDIRILTPFIPQNYLNTMKMTLNNLFKKSLFSESIIIINDLGMLHYIHQLYPHRKFCLGRNLIFSFDFTPWGELIYANETSQIQQIIKQVNLLDNTKIIFFKKYNVTSLESNITPNTFCSLKQLNSLGLDVYINESFFLYGIQRSCYIRRNSPDNQCDYKKCDMCQKITLTNQWEECNFFLNETVKYFPSVLLLRGNQICGQARFHNEHQFNRIISE